MLLEDVPGTAKTVLARAIAQSIEGAHASRIQCTPDLQPTDVTGLSIFNQRERDFEFRPGPVFANVVLVDEINRAMPKTQSALLEAMAEQQVTVDGVTRPLPTPFLVMATENPIEYEGTFPLPEAQLDRFFVRTTLGYPDARTRTRIVERAARQPSADAAASRASTLADIAAMSAAVEEVFVHEASARWIVDLVRATRELELVAIGSSVRGSLALNRAARAWAMLNGRRYVTPEDVERLFVPVLMHRLLFRPSFLAEIRDRGWDAAAADVQAPLSRARAEAGLRHRPRRPLAGGVATTAGTFPLDPAPARHRAAFGGVRSARRGHGSDVAGSREYQPGDDVALDRLAVVRPPLGSSRQRRVHRPRAVRRRVAARRRRRRPPPAMGIGASARFARLDKPRPLLETHRPDRDERTASRAASPATSTMRTARRFGGRRGASGSPEPRTFDRAVPRSGRRASRSGSSTFTAHRRDLPTAGVRLRHLGLPRCHPSRRPGSGRSSIAGSSSRSSSRTRSGSGSFPDVGALTIPYADPGDAARCSRLPHADEADRQRAENEAAERRPNAVFRSLGIEPVQIGIPSTRRRPRRVPALGRPPRHGTRRSGMRRTVLLALLASLALAVRPELLHRRCRSSRAALSARTDPRHCNDNATGSDLRQCGHGHYRRRRRPDVVDPARLHVVANFFPYEPVAALPSRRAVHGRFVQTDLDMDAQLPDGELPCTDHAPERPIPRLPSTTRLRPRLRPERKGRRTRSAARFPDSRPCSNQPEEIASYVHKRGKVLWQYHLAPPHRRTALRRRSSFGSLSRSEALPSGRHRTRRALGPPPPSAARGRRRRPARVLTRARARALLLGRGHGDETLQRKALERVAAELPFDVADLSEQRASGLVAGDARARRGRGHLREGRRSAHPQQENDGEGNDAQAGGATELADLPASRSTPSVRRS